MSVRRNNRGKWIVDVVYTHPDGRDERIQKTSPVQTKRGAERYERELRLALADGRRAEREAQRAIPTLAEFSKEFMATYVAANNKPSTRIEKEYAFRVHLLPFFGTFRLDGIMLRDIERFKSACLKKGLKPKTVNNLLTILGRTLRYAIEVEIIPTMPRVQFLRVGISKIDFLGFDEVGRLVKAAAAEREALAAILCAVDAGLRAGEIRALQWGDVDFVAAQTTVQRTDYRGHLGSPKGGRLRVVPMTGRLAAALKAIRHLKGIWVFSDARGDRWSRGEIDARLWRSCRKAGLRKLGWHSLRHTFCSHLAMRGAAARAIQELAGHASLQTTQRYMHLSPNVRRDAIRLLEDGANIAQTRAGEIGKGLKS